jgi:hypothetical protein
MAVMRENQNKTFIEDCWKSSLYKLCYEDGYYCFRKRAFIKYDTSKDSFAAIGYIRRKWIIVPAEDLEWVHTNILDKILGCDKQRWLHWVARAIAGEYKEKTWAVATGNRNCGKGVLTQLLIAAFGYYVSSFAAGELFTTKGDSDEAKRNKWLVPMQFKRILISNECRTDNEMGKQAKLDGNMIKSLSSGGDIIQARQLYSNIIDLQLQAKIMLMMNDVPKVEPDDANNTRCLFQFKVEFKDQLTEGEKNLMENNKKYPGVIPYRIEQADKDIKDKASEPRYVAAFAQIIIDAYTEELVTNDDAAAGDDGEQSCDGDKLLNLLDEFFTYPKWEAYQSSEYVPETNPLEHYVSVADVNAIIKDLNSNRERQIKMASVWNALATRQAVRHKIKNRNHPMFQKTVYINLKKREVESLL